MRKILLSRRVATSLLLGYAFAPSSVGQKKSATSTAALQAQIHNALGNINTALMKKKEQQLKETLRKVRNYQQLIASNADNRASLEKSRDQEIANGVRITSEILEMLDKSGLTQIVLKNHDAFLKGFSAKSLPREDLAILKEAGFNDEEINQFIAFFAANGEKILSRLDQPGVLDRTEATVKRHADKPPTSTRYSSYLKLLAGAAVASGNAALGVEAVPTLASIGQGLGMIADAVRELWQ